MAHRDARPSRCRESHKSLSDRSLAVLAVPAGRQTRKPARPAPPPSPVSARESLSSARSPTAVLCLSPPQRRREGRQRQGSPQPWPRQWQLAAGPRQLAAGRRQPAASVLLRRRRESRSACAWQRSTDRRTLRGHPDLAVCPAATPGFSVSPSTGGGLTAIVPTRRALTSRSRFGGAAAPGPTVMA